MKVLKVSGGAARCLRAVMAAGVVLAAPAALAQNSTQPPPAQTQIGPPQLRDFQITPRERIVTQPRPTPAPQQTQPAQPQAAQRPADTGSRPAPARALPPAPRAPVSQAPAVPAQPTVAAPAPDSAAPAPSTLADPAATTLPPAPIESPSSTAPEADAPVTSNGLGSGDGPPLWLLLLGGLGLGVIGYTMLTRRRAATRRAFALPAPEPVIAVPQGPRAPRPDPVPRPWIEVEMKPERTTADPDESVVEFEMTVRNNGGSPAKNIKLQAKLICSTPEQDKEIKDFQRKKPGEHRTLSIPDLPPGQELVLKGRVDVKREDIKAMRIDQRVLFVPLVAINAFYDWGTARSGQTSRSFLVGRERTDNVDKMAPFRLDLGPRVYRTLGQRPYKVERRV